MTTYNGGSDVYTTLQATGTGSILALPKLTSLNGEATQYYSYVQVEALAGGNVQLPLVSSISGGPVLLESDGASSQLDVSALASFKGISGRGNISTLQATRSGTVLDPALTTLDHANLTLDGTGTIAIAQIRTYTAGTFALSGGTAALSGLTDGDGSSFNVSGGANATLSALTTYNGGSDVYTTLQATGTGSILALPKLTSLNGEATQYYSYVQVEALAGGNVQLPLVSSISGGPVLLESDGASSQLDVSALASFKGISGRGNISTLQATRGGTVLDPALTTLDHANLTLDGTGTIAIAQIRSFTAGTFALSGGTAALSGLTDGDGSSFNVSGGANATLSVLTTYNGGSDVYTTLQATGTGSILALPKLTSLTSEATQYYSYVQVEALAGGNVQLPLVSSISGGPVLLESDGASSQLDVSALASFKGISGRGNISTLQATRGGTVLDPALTTLDHANLTLDGTGTIAIAQIRSFTAGTFALSGGTAALSGLTDGDGSSFNVSGGANATLSVLTTYNGGSDVYTTLQATGTGSVLAFPKLTSLTSEATQYYSYVQVEALAGGNVQLPLVATISGGPVLLESDGASSQLDVSALTSFSGVSGRGNFSTLQASNGGLLTATSGTLLLSTVNATVTVGGTIDAGTLRLLPGGTLSGDGTIAANVISAARTQPGTNSAGTLTIGGNFTQYGGGTLAVMLGGTGSGSVNDQLAVNGAVALDGTLAVSEASGYAPTTGDTFSILRFGSRSGGFTTFTGLAYTGGTFRTLYSGSDLSLVGAPADIRVSPTTGLVTSKAGDPAHFSVVLATQPSSNVTLGLSSSNPSEATVGPASLTFTPANWNVPQTVIVTGVNDGQPGSASYQVNFAPAVSTDPGYSGLTTPSLALTNLPDEVQDLQVANLAVSPSKGLNQGSTFTVNWNDLNAGNIVPTAPWYDQVTITNTTTGVVLSTAQVLADPNVEGKLAPGGSLARQFTFTLPTTADGVGNIQVNVAANFSHTAYLGGTSLVNTNLRTYSAGTDYPIAPSTLTVGGVDFALVPDGTSTTSLGIIQTGVGGPSYDLPVNIAGGTTLYTLINSAYGTDGATVGTVEVKGTNGADAVFNLVEGTNIRDHFNGGFEDKIAPAPPRPALAVARSGSTCRRSRCRRASRPPGSPTSS